MNKLLISSILVVGAITVWGAPRGGKGAKPLDVLKEAKCYLAHGKPAAWITEEGRKVLKLGGGPTSTCGVASFNFDMKRFAGCEVKMTLTYRLENAKQRPAGWDFNQKRMENFAPMRWHWARENAENLLYVHKEAPLPESGKTDGWQTLEARGFILPKDDLTDSGMDLQANIAKGGTVYVKDLRMEACTDVLMDTIVEKAGAKMSKSFKCEYSLPWRTAGKFRGIGMDWKCTKADLEKVIGWGVKLVRITGFRAQVLKFAELEPKLALLKENGVRVVLSPAVAGGSDLRGRYRIYTDEKSFEQYCAGLEALAKELVGRDDVWGIELLHEPEENVFMYCEEDKYNFWQVQYEAIKRIRAVNPTLPLIVSADGKSAPADYQAPVMRPFPFKDIWYNLQFYAPIAYTYYSKTWIRASPDGKMPIYPGTIGFKDFKWDMKRLLSVMEPVDAFQKKYGARFFVSEFAVFRRMPGAVQWLSDACDLFEKRADMWAFRSYNDYHGWDLEYMEDAPFRDAQKLPEGQESARLKLMKKRWTGKAK